MTRADLTFGAIAVLTLPFQQTAAWSEANTETNPSPRRLEAINATDMDRLTEYFGSTLELTLAKLPTSAVAPRIPWAGGAWEVCRDSINYQWNPNQVSASAKYAQAFGLDVTAFMDAVSKDNGIDSRPDLKPCTMQSECDDPKVLVICAKRKGKTEGRCITAWYGLGGSWPPAAILEKEPTCPITHNGVTFDPMDIKALITDVYSYQNTTGKTWFIGTRYNGEVDSIDQYHRHTSSRFRSLNPGVFHLTATNMLGLRNTTFNIDIDPGVKVLSQPVAGFKVLEQTPYSTKEAATKFYTLDAYPWNENAANIVYVKTSVSWINETYTDGGLVASGRINEFTVESTYTYLLEMDKDGKIIGGEWTGESNDVHMDFAWMVKEKPPQDLATSFGLSYANVEMLLEKSAACSG